MIVHSYYSSSDKDLIMDYLDSLTIEEQIDAFSVLENMEKGEFEKNFFKRWDKKSERTWKSIGKEFYMTGGVEMPFEKIDIQKKIQQKRQQPEFDKAWEESREEYRLIEEMIVARKNEKLTQTDLANMVGSKQQVISRIEKKESSPTLRMFCQLLHALGYELKIQKINGES